MSQLAHNEPDLNDLAPVRLTPVAEPPPYLSALPGSGVAVDLRLRVALVDGGLLDLTYLEMELLAFLVAHPYQVFTRAQLIGRVWGYGHVGDGRTVDVHVARLRAKLGPVHRRTISTVHRVGYRYLPAG